MPEDMFQMVGSKQNLIGIFDDQPDIDMSGTDEAYQGQAYNNHPSQGQFRSTYSQQDDLSSIYPQLGNLSNQSNQGRLPYPLPPHQGQLYNNYPTQGQTYATLLSQLQNYIPHLNHGQPYTSYHNYGLPYSNYLSGIYPAHFQPYPTTSVTNGLYHNTTTGAGNGVPQDNRQYVNIFNKLDVAKIYRAQPNTTMSSTPKPHAAPFGTTQADQERWAEMRAERAKTQARFDAKCNGAQLQREAQLIRDSAYLARNPMSARVIEARTKRDGYFIGVNGIGDRFVSQYVPKKKKNKNAILTTKFPLFLTLPMELQIRIWKEGILLPWSHRRIIRVHATEGGFFDISQKHEKERSMCDMVSADIGMLGASYNSREAYKEVLPYQLPSDNTSDGVNTSCIYFKSSDIIYMDVGENSHLWDLLTYYQDMKVDDEEYPTRTWISQIHHLAITEVNEHGIHDYAYGLKKFLPMFPNLKSLALVSLVRPTGATVYRYASLDLLPLTRYKTAFEVVEGKEERIKVLWMKYPPRSLTQAKLSEGCKVSITEIV